MATIADSSVWGDYWRGTANPGTDLLDDLLGAGDVQVGDLILLEVLRGFTDDRDHALVRTEMLKLQVHRMVTPRLALRASDNYRFLRRRGSTLRKGIDCLIATYCIEHAIELLHNDGDFDAFEQHLGLRVRRS